MATSNLEALNELIQKIKAGERRAKSNLEALNLLCVIAGGTGMSRSNLEALNELLQVFSPGGETQEKAVTITENGTTEITPDEGYTLSKATVNVNVPSGSSEYNAAIPSIDNKSKSNIYAHITKMNLDGIGGPTSSNLSNLFSQLYALKELVFGDFLGSFAAGTSFITDYMFDSCTSLESVDLSGFKGHTITEMRNMFYNAGAIKSINLEGVNLNIVSLSYAFYNCSALEYLNISGSILNRLYNFSNTFTGCTSLTNIVFADNCLINSSLMDVDLSPCPLTHDCAVDIFSKLGPRTNSPTIKLSSTTKGYLTDEEIAIATGKGWVIA